jgi:hypothetical protein
MNPKSNQKKPNKPRPNGNGSGNGNRAAGSNPMRSASRGAAIRAQKRTQEDAQRIASQ